MVQFQLRIYTLATREAAETYAHIHWNRHVPSLERFGICTHAVYQETGTAGRAAGPEVPPDGNGQTRVCALVSYDGEDFAAQNARYMASPEFRADMEGFDPRNIVNVEELNLEQVDLGLAE
ncbi:MAG: hypothetical protein LUG64_05135 [Clostridiales bacterium]|nr:hypothetical protein [Clostridiales bacterium]